MPIEVIKHRTGGPDVIADRHYFLDKFGKVTLDSTEAVEWLAREGAIVRPDIRERYGIPYAATPEAKPAEQKVAPQPDGEAEAEAEKPKSAAPSANKAVKPAKNKGVK